MPFAAIMITVIGYVCRGSVVSKICHAIQELSNCTTHDVDAVPDSNCLPFDTVFLLGKGEGDVVCYVETIKWVTLCTEGATMVMEGGVAQLEVGRGFVFPSITVFTWVHEEV